MESIKETLVQKLTDIADGFRTSRSLTETLSLDDMATLAAVPISSADNKLAQLADGSSTVITAEDLEGATKIAEYAFFYNHVITDVILPNTITSLEQYAFYHCYQLANITIPNSVRSIGNVAFRDCAKLHNLFLPNSITSFGDSVFAYCTGLSNVVLEEGLTQLGFEIFLNCSNITDITIPSSLNKMSAKCLSKTGIISMVIPNTITMLGYGAFKGCSQLSNVVLPNGIAELESDMFDGCTSLTNLTIPSNISSIKGYALRCGSATNKATITFLRATPPSIYSTTFNASYLEKIIVPAGSGDAYRTATNWANFADFIEEAAV